MDGNPWRSSDSLANIQYPSCKLGYYGPGLLVGKSLPAPVIFADDVYFQSYCHDNKPAYMAGTLYDVPATYLDPVVKDWNRYLDISGASSGTFQNSIYPIIISFTTNFIITFTMTVLAFINMRDKPYKSASRFLKLGSLIASINLAITLSNLICMLKDEYDHFGIAGKHCVMEFFEYDTTFITLDFISTFLLQCCQTFILMRTFERKQEKHVIFGVGISLSLISNLLWVVPKYHDIVHGFSQQNENDNWELLPPFVYMFKIVIAASYASLIINYMISKRRFCFRTLQLAFITHLALFVVLLLPGFFIADLANYWIYELSELFNTTCYVSCTYVVWEWLERLDIEQKREQAQSILGRAIYEDEQQNYMFAKYALKVQDALTRKESAAESATQFGIDDDGKSLMSKYEEIDDMGDTRKQVLATTTRTVQLESTTTSKSDNDAITDSDSLGHDIHTVNQVKFNTQRGYKDVAHEAFDSTVNNVVYFTDKVMLKTFGSSSFGGSSKSSSTNSKNDKEQVKKRIGLDRTNKVYVYSTKDIEFDSDIDEEDEDEDDGSSPEV